ncbi:uncharacterized protein [Miscanthus floridulus]|uniref:uncharacterized protein n=1 Tax=Miscanthus floridulus TaxID=154761 RepID=UPI0034578EB8
MTVKGSRKTLKAVNLDEPHIHVHLGHVGGEQEKQWYLDSSASNHMMSSKAAFFELNDDVTGTVKFGDGSRVGIQGRVTIIFSHYMWLQLLTSKDKAVAMIKKFKMRAEAESGKKLRVLRTDRGGEFTSVEFAAYCMD